MDSMTVEQAKKIVAESKREEEKEWEKANLAKARAIVGKYFRYRNSYGSGDDWWLYLEAVEMRGHKLVTRTYQNTSLVSEIQGREEQISWVSDTPITTGYKEISKAEFMRGKQAVLKRLGLA